MTRLCELCGHPFEGAVNAKFCQGCKPERRREHSRRYKKSLAGRTDKPKRRRLKDFIPEILVMAQEGKGFARIAGKLGYDAEYLRQAVKKRRDFSEVRKAMKRQVDQENADTIADVIHLFRPDAGAMFPADEEIILLRPQSAWLYRH